MIRKLLTVIKRFFREDNSSHSLFVPTFANDYGTKRITKWAKQWKIPNVSLFSEREASYKNAIYRLNNKNGFNRVFAFVGHGCPIELHTDTPIGKLANCGVHGCLLDCEDVLEALTRIHIISWACSSARVFGKKISSCKTSAFLGFNEEIVMLVNPESEALWSDLIKDLVSRITARHRIEYEDKQWLKDRISDLRRKIRTGEISTGSRYYDSLNRGYLKRIAKSVDVYIEGR